MSAEEIHADVARWHDELRGDLGYAENALGDMGLDPCPFTPTKLVPPWVVFAPSRDRLAAELLAELEHAGGVVVRLDGREMRTDHDLFRVFARELNFPAYFGHNWDALVDCLRHLHPAWPHPRDLAVIISHADQLASPMLFAACAAAALEYANLALDADGVPDQDHETFAFHIVLEHDGDLTALPAIEDDDRAMAYRSPYLMVW